MFAYALLWTLGVLLAFHLTSLPKWSALLISVVFLVGPFFWCRKKVTRRIILLILVPLLGVVWVKTYSQLWWRPPLAQHYFQKRQRIKVHVVSMPHCDNHRCQFVVTTHDLDSHKRRFQVYWYSPHHFIKPGQRWQMTLKLKPVHDAGNPGELGFERWGLYKGIDGFGYVKTNHQSARILSVDHGIKSLLAWTRYQLLLQLKHHVDLKTTQARRLIPALALGDRHLMTNEMWRVLQKTGTNHLVAISGLHVGLIATWLFVLGLGIWWLLPTFVKLRFTAQQIAALIACTGAGLYSLLAGLPLSTQRAFLMLVIAMSGYFARRYLTGWQVVACVLMAILLLEPTAVLAMSFWLSFVAVCWIIYLLMGRQRRRIWGVDVVYLQIVLCLGLMPVTLFFFNKTSLIAAFVNLVAIPWVGFVIVPLTLLGLWTTFVSSTLAHGLLLFASWNLSGFWGFLKYLSQLSWITWQMYLELPGLLALMLACLILLAPKGWPSKSLSFWLILPVLWQQYEVNNSHHYAIALAVKKGTAVIIHAKDNYNLLYLDGIRHKYLTKVVDEVVIPALLKQHIHQLRWLIVDHHIMHIASVNHLHQLAQHKWSQIKPCSRRTLLSSTKQYLKIAGPNEPSDYDGCLVSWQYKHQRLLIAGHIQQRQEQQFLKSTKGATKHTVLVAPMGGSRQSSSWSFIKHVRPKDVIISAGFMNPYDWPARQTLRRYHLAGAKIYQTQNLGAININMDHKPVKIDHYLSKKAWWQTI